MSETVGLDAEIREGLLGTPRRLPCALFYDALGSTLFEAITRLPEYGVARACRRQLEARRGEMLPSGAPLELVELGPGSGCKAKLLVETLRLAQPRVRFVGVDVSARALEECRRALESVEGVQVEAIEADYLAGLARSRDSRAPGTRRLVAFLGSNLSNFERDAARAFLGSIRRMSLQGDALLLGVDLDKDPSLLRAAYDDELGVTAAFDLNALVRLNREWGADFDVSAFAHEARWSPRERRVEMHLVARRPCEIEIRRLGIGFRMEEGESIWTESSHRFTTREITEWGEAAGWTVDALWIDEDWPYAHVRLLAT